MREAFRLGADVVEIDVHRTPEDVFAVFHDWTLDCRTNGTGVTHKHALVDLQALDVAYNIDDGSGSFSLRGQGTGLMPTLNDVLADPVVGPVLINFKSDRASDGKHLVRLLAGTEWSRTVFAVYGGAKPVAAATSALPDMRGFDKARLRTCLLSYFGTGWAGFVPRSCRETLVMVPQNVAPLLWGWPHRFTARLKAHGTDVILAGDYDGSGFASGIDTGKALRKVPQDFDGYIWTNRIEEIGPALQAR